MGFCPPGATLSGEECEGALCPRLCSVILGRPEPQWFRTAVPCTFHPRLYLSLQEVRWGPQHPWLSAWPCSLAAWEGTGMPATSQLAVDEVMPSRVRDEGMNFKLCSQPSLEEIVPQLSHPGAPPGARCLAGSPASPSKSWAFPKTSMKSLPSATSGLGSTRTAFPGS